MPIYNGEEQTRQPYLIHSLTEIVCPQLKQENTEYAKAWSLYYKFYLKLNQRLKWHKWLVDLSYDDFTTPYETDIKRFYYEAQSE